MEAGEFRRVGFTDIAVDRSGGVGTVAPVIIDIALCRLTDLCFGRCGFRSAHRSPMVLRIQAIVGIKAGGPILYIRYRSRRGLHPFAARLRVTVHCGLIRLLRHLIAVTVKRPCAELYCGNV